MKIEFNVTTTPLGRASGLQKVEIVNMDNDDGFTLKDGALTFLCNTGLIIYAPGTWALVTTSEISNDDTLS